MTGGREFVGEQTTALLSAFAGAHIVDLSHTLEPSMPVYPTHPQFFSMPWRTGDISSMKQLVLGEHTGTHLDSPAHFYPEGSNDRRITVADIPVASLIGPAVKLDLQHVEPGAELGRRDLENWEKDHRMLTPGESVVLHFGWASRWGTLPGGQDYIDSWPGIDRSAAQLLVERSIRLVGTDCLGIDGSSSTDLDAHLVLLGRGIPIVENLCQLEEVPTEFLLITLPLRIADGTGSPIRAVAVFGAGSEGVDAGS